MSKITASMIIIGNEVLSGRTQDANLAYLGTSLGELGIVLVEVRVIRDDESAIINAVNTMRLAYDYVFTTGGIGPTHDDITTACVGKAFGAPLWRHPLAVSYLLQQYGSENLNDARLKMAYVPEGAVLIENPVSKAPGFQLDNVFVLPGVPRIMQAMFEGMKHRLRGGAPLTSRSIGAFTPEGSIAEKLARVQQRHRSVEIGSYPFVRSGRFGTSLVVRSNDQVAIDAAVEDIVTFLHAMGVEPIEDTVENAA
jgi:molybdenum cofactor synthesis domain-containing protein